MCVGTCLQDLRRTPKITIPKCLTGVVELVELAVEIGFAVGAPFHRVLLKEAQSVSVVRFLARVHQWHVQQGRRKHPHGVAGVAVTFFNRAVPAVLVVVGDEAHAVRIAWETFRLFFEVISKHLHRLLSLSHLVGQMVKVPSVAHVKRAVVVIGLFRFRQHEHVWVDRFQLATRHVPKRGRHFHGHIATEPIDAAVGHPKGHGIRHRSVQPIFHTAFPIQLGDVPPVRTQRRLEVAEAVEKVVLAVFFRPHAVKRAVVRHPIQNDPHAEVMGGCRQGTHVIVRAIVGVDRAVILDAVRASKGATSRFDDEVVLVFSPLSVHVPNGVNGHQPQNVHAERLQSGQIWNERFNRAFWRVLTQIDFVDGGILGPGGMNQLVFLFCRAADMGRACGLRGST